MRFGVFEPSHEERSLRLMCCQPHCGFTRGCDCLGRRFAGAHTKKQIRLPASSWQAFDMGSMPTSTGLAPPAESMIQVLSYNSNLASGSRIRAKASPEG
jgi:hypothetical protein